MKKIIGLAGFGRKVIVCGLIASTLFLGCKRDELVEPNSTPTENVLYDNVRILEEEDLGKIVSLDYQTINFSEAMNYSLGDIIVGGASENTPEGFLLKIESSENHKYFVVSQASFEDAVQEGSFHLTKKLTDDSKDGGRIEFNIPNVILYDFDGDTVNTIDDQIRMNGLAYIDPEIVLDIEWNWGLKKFEFGVKGEVGAEIEVGTGVESFDFSKERIIPGPVIPSFPIVVCGLPSVVSPKLEFVLGVEGDVSPMNVSILEKINLESKIIYENHNWSYVTDTSKFFSLQEFNPPEQLSVKGYVKPKLTLIVNHFAGPSLAVEGYLKGEVDVNSNPWWTVKAGGEVLLGAELEIFGKDILNYDHPVFSMEKIIAEGWKVNSPPVPNFEISPDEGNVHTPFEFDASSSYDPETSVENLEVRWDWESDGGWDTEYSTNKVESHVFGESGEKEISLQVRDGEGLEEIISKDWFVGVGNPTGIFVDGRDGQEYKTVTIGNQTWMAENLNYISSESYVYGDDPVNGDIYGRLYQLSAAHQGCPSGWHLPSNAEWEILTTHLGSSSGGKMKETGFEYWDEPNLGATNESGFSARGGGGKDLSNPGGYKNLKLSALFWTSSGTNYTKYSFNLQWANSSYTIQGFSNVYDGARSVRCVKND